MSTNLYVGNFNFDTTESGLSSLFSEFGEVLKVQVITDRNTGRSRGFGFVEMGSEEAASKAVASLDGHNVGGRSLTVNVAKPRR